MSPIQSVPFDQPEAALKQVLAALGRKPDAVLAVDDAAWNWPRFCANTSTCRATRPRRCG